MTKQQLLSRMDSLRSNIIRTEYEAEHLNQELQDMHLEYEDLQVDLSALENDEEDMRHYNGGE